MFTPKFEMTVPLSREDCFNRLQTGLDFSHCKGFHFGTRRTFIVQRQQVAFDRENINRMRFDLYGQGGKRLTLVIELYFVDMKTTYISGEVKSYANAVLMAIIGIVSFTVASTGLILMLLEGDWWRGLPLFVFGMLFLASTYQCNVQLRDYGKQIINYTLQEHTY